MDAVESVGLLDVVQAAALQDPREHTVRVTLDINGVGIDIPKDPSRAGRNSDHTAKSLARRSCPGARRSSSVFSPPRLCRGPAPRPKRMVARERAVDRRRSPSRAEGHHRLHPPRELARQQLERPELWILPRQALARGVGARVQYLDRDISSCPEIDACIDGPHTSGAEEARGAVATTEEEVRGITARETPPGLASGPSRVGAKRSEAASPGPSFLQSDPGNHVMRQKLREPAYRYLAQPGDKAAKHELWPFLVSVGLSARVSPSPRSAPRARAPLPRADPRVFQPVRRSLRRACV